MGEPEAGSFAELLEKIPDPEVNKMISLILSSTDECRMS